MESCSGYTYFRKLLGVVEIARGDRLEKVYFHIPNVCMYLTEDLKTEILYVIDRSSPIAKVTSFNAKAAEIVSDIDYHRRLTERLEETFSVLPAFFERWPWCQVCCPGQASLSCAGRLCSPPRCRALQWQWQWQCRAVAGAGAGQWQWQGRGRAGAVAVAG